MRRAVAAAPSIAIQPPPCPSVVSSTRPSSRRILLCRRRRRHHRHRGSGRREGGIFVGRVVLGDGDARLSSYCRAGRRRDAPTTRRRRRESPVGRKHLSRLLSGQEKCRTSAPRRLPTADPGTRTRSRTPRVGRRRVPSRVPTPGPSYREISPRTSAVPHPSSIRRSARVSCATTTRHRSRSRRRIDRGKRRSSAGRKSRRTRRAEGGHRRPSPPVAGAPPS
jgi:hypothetical protein